MQRIHLIIIVLLLAIIASGDLRICSKCGYEAEASVADCGHCGATLPITKTNDTSPPPDIPDNLIGPEGYLDPSIVLKEVIKGNKEIDSGNHGVALFFFRNGEILNKLTKEDKGNKRSIKLASLIKQAKRDMRKTVWVCKSCKGSGKATIILKSLSTSDTDLKKRSSAFKACEKCYGKGKVLKRANLQTLKGIYGRSLAKYRTIQNTQRMSRVGEAWIDSEIAKRLSVEQEIVLRKAAAQPCDDCIGTGYDDCRKCDGEGSINCTNTDCDDGWVQEKRDGLEGVSSISTSVKCSTCLGRSVMTCEECQGKGGKACKSCKGTGEREMCRKCGGEGLAECRKCRGSGSYKGGPCSYCNGVGHSKCTSCNGDGRKE